MRRRPVNFGPCIIQGCEREQECKNLCKIHYGRKYYDEVKRNKIPGRKKARKISLGETIQDRNGYLWEKVGRREYGRQHRLVMERHLERKFLPNETVHHKNGDTSDNRLENLELWTSRHPRGQRVDDLLEFAHEIIALYGSK